MHHKDLEVWKKAIELVKLVYIITDDLPHKEEYGLCSQIRRAVVSIPSNIAEGCARFSSKETVRFLDIALGSLAEVDTQLIIARELGYLQSNDEVLELLGKVNALLIGLRKSVNERSE